MPPFPAILHEAKGGMGRDQLPVICDMRRKNVWRFGRESQCYTFDGNSWHPTFETINAIAGVSFEQIEQIADKFYLLLSIDGDYSHFKRCKNILYGLTWSKYHLGG